MASRPTFKISTGQPNQYGGRQGTINIFIETQGLTDQINGIVRDLDNTTGPITEANHELAQQLRDLTRFELEGLIADRRRVQRPEQRLIEALKSEKTISWTLQGFVLGYLDDFPEVSTYWRGLEYGSFKHIGQRMIGFWKANDDLEGPREGGKDAIGFVAGKKVYHNTPFEWTIHNPIVAYEFFDKGLKAFRDEYLTDRGGINDALSVYVYYFRDLPYLTEAFFRDVPRHLVTPHLV